MTTHKKTMPPLGKYEKNVVKTARLLDNFHKSIYVVAGAKWKKYSACKTNVSYKTTEELMKLFDIRLQKALLPLGKLGTKPKGCPNYIGNCAEQHACNEVLLQDKEFKAKIKDIKFSLAYRPRTCQIVPYCSNCTKTFNIHN